MEYEEETPVVESRSLLGACIGRGPAAQEESSPEDCLRAVQPGVENMSQSYHEIFDTQVNTACIILQGPCEFWEDPVNKHRFGRTL